MHRLLELDQRPRRHHDQSTDVGPTSQRATAGLPSPGQTGPASAGTTKPQLSQEEEKQAQRDWIANNPVCEGLTLDDFNDLHRAEFCRGRDFDKEIVPWVRRDKKRRENGERETLCCGPGRIEDWEAYSATIGTPLAGTVLPPTAEPDPEFPTPYHLRPSVQALLADEDEVGVQPSGCEEREDNANVVDAETPDVFASAAGASRVEDPTLVGQPTPEVQPTSNVQSTDEAFDANIEPHSTDDEETSTDTTSSTLKRELQHLKQDQLLSITDAGLRIRAVLARDRALDAGLEAAQAYFDRIGLIGDAFEQGLATAKQHQPALADYLAAHPDPADDDDDPGPIILPHPALFTARHTRDPPD